MRCSVIPFDSFGLSPVSALRYWHGADFSSLLLLESTTNIQYASSSTAPSQPFEQILYNSGVNLARHLANGWDKADISYFYTGIFSVGETANGQDGFLTLSDVDVMGFTFYLFYGTAATLENLGSSMDNIVSTYKKVGGIIKQLTG